ncbi:hypothetical protein QTP88_002489 [Uroleucon formosanum]
MRLKGRKLFNVDRKSVVKRLLNIDSNLVNASVSKSVANFVEVINSYIRPNLEPICAGPQSTPINGFPNFLIASDPGQPPSDFWPYCYYIVVVYPDQPAIRSEGYEIS